jgi:hypothetical protein
MKKQFSIPIQLICIDSDGYHLMVTLSINGLRANAILDTGASRKNHDDFFPFKKNSTNFAVVFLKH